MKCDTPGGVFPGCSLMLSNARRGTRHRTWRSPAGELIVLHVNGISAGIDTNFAPVPGATGFPHVLDDESVDLIQGKAATLTSLQYSRQSGTRADERAHAPRVRWRGHFSLYWRICRGCGLQQSDGTVARVCYEDVAARVLPPVPKANSGTRCLPVRHRSSSSNSRFPRSS